MSKMGRPTAYDPKYCQMLIDHMSQGLSFESFAAITGTSKSTLYEWVKNEQDFSVAKDIASDKCRLFWEKLGVDHVLNVSESMTGPGGEKMSNSTSLNTSVWIFNMKNRFKDEWKDRHETEISGSIGLDSLIQETQKKE